MTLPPAAISIENEMSVVLDTGHVGWVRIYYQRRQYRHYRNRFWVWIVDRAEQVQGPRG